MMYWRERLALWLAPWLVEEAKAWRERALWAEAGLEAKRRV